MGLCPRCKHNKNGFCEDMKEDVAGKKVSVCSEFEDTLDRNLPEKLRKVINEYLDNHEGAKLLTTQKRQSTPYKDKSIISIRFAAYMVFGNLLTVLTISECSNPKWSDTEVIKSSMIAGDIIVLMEHSSEWFYKNY